MCGGRCRLNNWGATEHPHSPLAFARIPSTRRPVPRCGKPDIPIARPPTQNALNALRVQLVDAPPLGSPPGHDVYAARLGPIFSRFLISRKPNGVDCEPHHKNCPRPHRCVAMACFKNRNVADRRSHSLCAERPNTPAITNRSDRRLHVAFWVYDAHAGGRRWNNHRRAWAAHGLFANRNGRGSCDDRARLV